MITPDQWRRRITTVWLGLMWLGISSTLVFAQSDVTITVTVAAPIFLTPNEQLAPLRVAKEGSLLRLIEQEGDWCNIEFQDPEYGRRSGYIRSKFVHINPSPKALEPQDLSIQGADTSPHASSSSEVSSARVNEAPVSSPRPPAANVKPTVFTGLRLRQLISGKEKDTEVRTEFNEVALIVTTDPYTDLKPKPLRTIGYSSINIAEYSSLGSRDSLTHWLTLTIQPDAERVVLRLDKKQYRSLLGEFTKRTGLIIRNFDPSR
jgi:hypothetical protein